MRKGIAVPYIIALILGIVVIGLLGYWFFVLGGQTGGSGTQQACNAKVASFCQQWSLNAFTDNCPPGTAILIGQVSCSPSDLPKIWGKFAQGCTSTPAPTQPQCQSLYGQVGTPTGTTSGTTSTTGTTRATGGTTITGA